MVRTEAGGLVTEIVDKPRQTRLTYMWGCMIWRSRFTEHLHLAVQRGTTDFADIMNSAIASGLRFRGVLFLTATTSTSVHMRRSWRWIVVSGMTSGLNELADGEEVRSETSGACPDMSVVVVSWNNKGYLAVAFGHFSVPTYGRPSMLSW